MLIDWFTVVAQAINFLILVWLLKRFLYKPILDAIDARELQIAEQLADADARKAEARRERDEFRLKNEDFAVRRETLLSQMANDVEGERQVLLADTRQAAEALRAKLIEATRREQQGLNDEIGRRAQAEVFSIARKTLADLADSSLEERIAVVFIRRLRELNADAKRAFNAAMITSSESARVRTAFELPHDIQSAIRKSINEVFETDIPIRFETWGDVIGGIELSAGGRRFAWTIADYLQTLEKSLDELTPGVASVDDEPESERVQAS
jgi:F-type H+-transporting ATPase subunit b